jgi:exonuclease SbcC
MIPLTLSISGFLSYRDPVEIDFTSFDLACIAGANGAGKSSILDAITWVLFGKARKTDDSLINTQSDLAEVTLTFAYESNLYRVSRSNPRGKTGMLEFHIAQQDAGYVLGARNPDSLTPNPLTPNSLTWKPLTERTLRATQSRIEETLRLDYDTFINAAFFLQGKADQFTQQRSADRKRILASILGLEIWEFYRQRAAERRKAVEAEIITLDGRLSEINTELGEEQTRKARLAELEAELARLVQTRTMQESALDNIKKTAAALEEQRKLVDTLARQLDSAQKRMSELEIKFESRQSEKESHTEILSRASQIQDTYQSLQQSRAELARWDEIAGQFREHEKRRQPFLTEIEAERARLETERAALLERQSELEKSLAEVETFTVQRSNVQHSLEEFQSSIEKRKALEVELAAAQESLANAKAENPRLKAEMDELKSRIDQLTETEGAACPLCGQPLSPEERQNLVEELNLLGTAMGDKFRANKKLLVEADEKVTGLKLQVESLLHLDDDLLAQKNELNKLNNQIEQITAQSESWQKEGLPRLEELTFNLQHSTFAPNARAALAEIDAELKHIGYDAAAHDAVRLAVADSAAIEDDFRTLERAQATLEPLEREISELNLQLATFNAEVKQQQTEHDDAVAALAAAEASAPDVQQAQSDLLKIKEQENILNREVGAAQQKVSVLADLRSRRKTLEAERETLAQQVGQFKQLERAFGKDGVPALLIEQALPQIEAKANEILDRLSGGNMSVRFQTQRELKTRDDLKETLDIIISDSAGQRDYDMFSGGEAFRVNFAIRLALSEVLAQRAGARLQTLVIDEGFGSQDEIGRQRLIEAINTVKADFAKILVITHIESLKDAFPTRIEVEKTARGSVITLV